MNFKSSFKFPALSVGFVIALLMIGYATIRPFASTSSVSAQSRVSASGLDTSRFMDISEIRPGMRGYGLTVFHGTTPERFDVEVIDVLHGFRPDQDLILIRTEHPELELATTVAGMSGSPIYLNDRMIGAYAYGWMFGRRPVAGVTPIANMLRELHRSDRVDAFPTDVFPRSAAASSSREAAHAQATQARVRDPYLGQSPHGAFASLRSLANSFALNSGEAHLRTDGSRVDSGSIQAASTPLLLGGFDSQTASQLAQVFAPFGIDVLQAGGSAGAASPTPSDRYVDGGAIAVTLVRGDLNVQAIGTVTYVEGQRLVAFGHPMMEAGELGLPTSTARIVHVLASYQRSFKIAEGLTQLGTLVQDRQSAIVVDTRISPTFIPVHVKLNGLPTGVRSDWNFEVAHHRMLTPSLLAGAIMSAIKSSAPETTDLEFHARSRVSIDVLPNPVEVHDVGNTNMGLPQQTSLAQIRLFDLLEATYGNPFQRARVTQIDLEIDLQFGRNVLEIVDASTDELEVNPGEEITLTLLLRRYGDSSNAHFAGAPQEETRTLRLRIPEEARGQSLQINLQPGPEAEVDFGEIRNLSQIVDVVRHRYPASSLLATMRLPSRGIRVRDRLVGHLPASAMDALLTQTTASRTRPYQSLERFEYPMNSIVSGSARVDVRVRNQPRSF